MDKCFYLMIAKCSILTNTKYLSFAFSYSLKLVDSFYLPPINQQSNRQSFVTFFFLFKNRTESNHDNRGRSTSAIYVKTLPTVDKEVHMSTTSVQGISKDIFVQTNTVAERYLKHTTVIHFI